MNGSTLGRNSKINVLYASNFLDGTGYSRAATEGAIALDVAGINVACRNVRLGSSPVMPSSRLSHLLKNSYGHYDAVIQHCLPHHMEYHGNLGKNIGIFASETSHFRYSSWPDHLNMMDLVLVPNRQMSDACVASGVRTEVRVVPHASDVTKYQRSYPRHPTVSEMVERGNFIFYTVGEFVERKNLTSLLKAFHLEFDPSEPVSLVIKTSKSGHTADECKAAVRGLASHVKQNLKLHGGREDFYKQEVVLTEWMSDSELMALHSSCDCFVQPSRGESFSYPSLDGMALGKTPIVTACTGFLEYIDSDTGWLVDCHEEPCFGETSSFPFLHTGREDWWESDVRHLQKCMREAYGLAEERKRRSEAGIDRGYQFSSEAVGKLLAQAILD